MKKSNSNFLEFPTKFINSNFRIKVFGRTEDGKKINTLVGVSGILKLIGAELFNKLIKRALKAGAVDYSVDGTMYWNRNGRGQQTRVFVLK